MTIWQTEVIEIAKKFDEYINQYSDYLPENYLANIPEKLLEAIIPTCEKEEDKEKAYFLLNEIKKKK